MHASEVYELVAIGPAGGQRWRRPLPADAAVRLGRSPLCGWAVPWDMRISREHADLQLAGQRLHVRCLESAHNAIHFGPQRVRAAAIGPGESFRIGSTVFCLVPAGRSISCRPLEVGEGPSQDGPGPQSRNSGAGQVASDSAVRREHGDCPQPEPCRSPLEAYVLVEPIHRGAWTQIYIARHRWLGRWAAVQTLEPGLAAGEEAAARLRQKCLLLASFRHPCLPICHDAGELDGQPFLAMEWLAGQDLTATAAGRPVPVATAVHIGTQAARALAYVHRCGVVHREIGPAHLLLDRDGQLSLIGWSRALQLGDGELPAFEQRGRQIGDPRLAAPEQLADCRHVDRRADIYSLGCTLVSLLTGRYPPAAEPLAAAGWPRLHLREFRPDVPQPLQEILGRMTAGDPAARFARMEEVSAALESLGFAS